MRRLSMFALLFVVVAFLAGAFASTPAPDRSSLEASLRTAAVRCKSTDVEGHSHGQEQGEGEVEYIDRSSITYLISWRKRLAAAMAGEESIESLPCRDVQYLQHLLTVERSAQNALSSKQKLSKVVDEGEGSYQASFEGSVIDGKILRGRVSAEVEYPNLDLTELPHLRVESTGDAPLRRLLDDSALGKVIAPKILVNNYLWRIAKQAENIPEDDSLDLLQHWPSVSALKSGESTAVTVCPLEMNQLIWGVRGGNLRLRIFSQHSQGHLGPRLGTQYSMLYNTSLHYLGFESDGFTGIDEANVKFRDVELGEGQFVFIPPSNPIGVKTESVAASATAVTYLKACFVDASNLNIFRDSLEKLQHHSVHYKGIVSSINALDFTMARTPKDMNLKAISQFNVSAAAAEASVQTEKDRNNRRKRQANANLKDWQDNRRWDGLVASLTMPRPSKPVIVEPGRNGGKVSWTSSFAPKARDLSVFGFNITICNSSSTSLSPEATAAGTAGHDCEYVVAFRVPDTTTPAENKVDLIEPNLDSDVSPKEFHAVLKSFKPSTEYILRVTTVFSSFQSLPSDVSEPFKTLDISAPSVIPCTNTTLKSQYCFTAERSGPHGAKLIFQGAKDDGGNPILGYLAFARILNNPSMSSDWRLIAFLQVDKNMGLIGGKYHADIGHLYHNTTYQFRISSVNIIGNSSLSSPSNMVTTEALDRNSNNKALLLGKFHKHNSIVGYQNVISGRTRESHKMVFLSDSAQSLVVRNYVQHHAVADLEKFDVWRSHFSPQDTDVEGDCVFIAKSSDASDLDLHGRVVVVPRDGVTPFYQTASHLQKAGALAVVISDNGTCDAYDQSCVPGAVRASGELFGQYDPPRLWRDIKIPVVLVLRSIAESLSSHGACVMAEPISFRHEL